MSGLNVLQANLSQLQQSIRSVTLSCRLVALTAFVVWYLSASSMIGLFVLSIAAGASFIYLHKANNRLQLCANRILAPPPQATFSTQCNLPTTPAITPGTSPSISAPSLKTSLSGIHGVPIFWPSSQKDIENKLGLTSAEMLHVERHVTQALLAQRSGREVHATLSQGISYRLLSGREVNTSLPITVWFVLIGKIIHIFLFTKKTFTQGGERRIRYVYDLTEGKFYLKKRICGQFEHSVLGLLEKDREHRGITSFIAFKRKTREGKLQTIEKQRDCDFRGLLTKGYLSLTEISTLFFDIVSDLKCIHSMSVSDVSITSIGYPDYQLGEIDASHGDLSLANCLAFTESRQLRGELCDFSSVGNPLRVLQTAGYASPEYVALYEELGFFFVGGPQYTSSREDFVRIAQFNHSNGRKRDVWSLGLIVLQLVMQKSELYTWQTAGCFDIDLIRHGLTTPKITVSAEIPPLECFRRRLAQGEQGHTSQWGLLQLQQKELDTELQEIQADIRKQNPTSRREINLIFESISAMLRIDPIQRCTIEEIYNKLAQHIYPDSAA